MTDNEQREIETTAMNIVYQISDILVPDGADGVKLRQANNDKMINFTAGLITALIKQHTDREVEPYRELIMAVESKFEGETRHQTALRYIQEAERHDGEQTTLNQLKESE